MGFDTVEVLDKDQSIRIEDQARKIPKSIDYKEDGDIQKI